MTAQSHSFCSGKEEAQAPGARGGGGRDPGILERATAARFLPLCLPPARPHSWRAAFLGLGVGTSAAAPLFVLSD